MKKVNKGFLLKKGIDEKIIKRISQIKNEPKWMLNIRLKAFRFFVKSKNPLWAKELKKINFNDYVYYSSIPNNWNELPKKIKQIFKKKSSLNTKSVVCGENRQYDSEIIYNSLQKKLKDKGIIFCRLEQAVKSYPSLVKKYFAKLMKINENKYVALNTAVWSGGSFIYIPKNVNLTKPLQTHFHINTKNVGQFERTLIIVEQNSSLKYIEGCTALISPQANLHTAVVEIFVKNEASCRYITIQNWSKNVLNLANKRAIVNQNGKMEWIDGNFGSKLNMKYPCIILQGKNSMGKYVSIAHAKKNTIHDTGAKMIHLGQNTKSYILAKTINDRNSQTIYRGLVKIAQSAKKSFSNVMCDTLLLDDNSLTQTIPREIIGNTTSTIKHEAKITNLDREKMFYLNNKKIDYSEAKNLLSFGFIQSFTKELPMEYAIEIKRLMNEY